MYQVLRILKLPMILNTFPLILALAIYLLILWIRATQGGWDLKVDLFTSQRQLLDQKISQLLPSPQAPLLSGILLGQNKALPGSLKLSLRDTSTLHIVVASGQNLSMVAGFFLALSGLIKRRLALISGLLAVIFYVLLTGAQVPILRAAIMFSLASLAEWTGRERSGAWVLFVTAGLMLLINPHWLLEISFQLSVLATFGVVVLAPIIGKYLQVLPKFIATDLAVTLGAQIMVTPVIAQNFHQISLVSVITNLLVLWTIAPIMIGGSAMLLTSFVWQLGGQIIGWGLNTLLNYFIYIVQFFGSLPFAWEYIGEQFWLFWIGYYLLLASALKILYDQRSNENSPLL